MNLEALSFECRQPLTAHRRKAHLPENRSLRIYLNKTEQYQILSIRKIFLPDVPPRTDQTVRDTASQSVLLQIQFARCNLNLLIR